MSPKGRRSRTGRAGSGASRPDARLLALPEFRPLKRLATPGRIQDFLNALPFNTEPHGETCSSPLVALRRESAHCMEGALIAALSLWMHGDPPLILDLDTTPDDVAHAVALFRRGRFWGAISKTNHAVLRYREPIFRDVRELAVSYFHEYFRDDRRKTLRTYSRPFDLRRWHGNWTTNQHHLWDLQLALDNWPHFKLLNRSQLAGLRPADAVEVRAGKITEW